MKIAVIHDYADVFRTTRAYPRLQEHEVIPVGATRPVPVDLRVVAATHRPLARNINEGSFREDLYYRLAVVEIVLPPLRSRREDIPALATAFYERFAGQGRAPAPELDEHRSAILKELGLS